MGQLAYYLIDAFSTEAFGGNAAGVVPEASGLTEEQMQRIARELNQSETVFLFPSESPDVDYRLRYFTPAEEINFCGHATIASAWLLASKYGHLEQGHVTFETNVGIIPVRLEQQAGELQRVTMTQVAPMLKEIAIEKEAISRLVGIPLEQIDDRYPIGIASTGNWHLLIPVKSKAAIDQATPNLTELAAMNRRFEISTTHLFTYDTAELPHDLYTRDFCPAIGIPEDPVTGAANGALAGYLVLTGQLAADQQHELVVAQGHAIGRPGTLYVTITPKAEHPLIQVGGAAHITASGHFFVTE